MLPQDLKEKFHEWRNDTFLEKKAHFEKLAKEGQFPKYMIISCVDSRVDPNSMFKTEAGDFFIHRNIANLVPPYDYLTEHSGTIAAIEFGVTALNIKNIVVMGHSGCGGIKNGYLACKENKFTENSSISNWLQLLKPAYMKISKKREKENIGELEKISIERLRGLVENKLDEVWGLGDIFTLNDYAVLSGLDYKQSSSNK